MSGPEVPAACLPGEEPLVDADLFERAGRVLVATIPDERERRRGLYGRTHHRIGGSRCPNAAAHAIGVVECRGLWPSQN